jgi:hypothetical protein
MVAQKKQPLQSSEGQVHPTASRLLPSQPTVHTFPLSIDPKVLLSFHFGARFHSQRKNSQIEGIPLQFWYKNCQAHQASAAKPSVFFALGLFPASRLAVPSNRWRHAALRVFGRSRANPGALHRSNTPPSRPALLLLFRPRKAQASLRTRGRPTSAHNRTASQLTANSQPPIPDRVPRPVS